MEKVAVLDGFARRRHETCESALKRGVLFPIDLIVFCFLLYSACVAK